MSGAYIDAVRSFASYQVLESGGGTGAGGEYLTPPVDTPSTRSVVIFDDQSLNPNGTVYSAVRIDLDDNLKNFRSLTFMPDDVNPTGNSRTLWVQSETGYLFFGDINLTPP